VTELIREVPASVLAIYAHPDDPDVSCGGTLARWSAAGCAVHVLICARGDKGSADRAVDPEELANLRADEARCSADVLGVTTLRILSHLDGDLENDNSLRSELVAAIREARPDVLVAPDPQAVFFGDHHYNHRDHRVVGWAALDAASPAASSPLYFRDKGAAHQITTVLLTGSLSPNAAVDITDTIDSKLAAVECHRTQLTEPGAWIADALRERAGQHGMVAGVSYAETFRRIHLAP